MKSFLKKTDNEKDKPLAWWEDPEKIIAEALQLAASSDKNRATLSRGILFLAQKNMKFLDTVLQELAYLKKPGKLSAGQRWLCIDTVNMYRRDLSRDEAIQKAQELLKQNNGLDLTVDEIRGYYERSKMKEFYIKKPPNQQSGRKPSK